MPEDWISSLLYGVWLTASTLPLAFFLGSCSKCCDRDCEPCSLCTTPSMTVTLAGFSSGNNVCDCNLNGTYTLHRGEGYEPIALVRIFANRGYGARIKANLIFDSGTGTYTVGSVDIEAAGIGYTPDAYAEIVIQGGVVACNDPPVFEVELARVIPPQPPVIEFDIFPPQDSGYGAKFEIIWSAENETEGSETWSVAALNVVRGGRDYLDRSTIFIRANPSRFAVLPDLSDPGASLHFVGTIVIDHAVPVLEQVLVESDNGGGAEFSHSWVLNQQILDDIGETELDYRYWQLAELTVTNGGFGYEVGDSISYTLANGPENLRGRDAHDTYGGTEESPFLWGEVTSVDENGTITGIQTTRPVLPSHSRTDGIIQRVIVEEAGEYYGYGGVKRVTILDGGTIWPLNSCEYSGCFEIQCGEGTICRQITASIGPSGGSLRVIDNYSQVLIASFTADDESGPCITGGTSSASAITLANGECNPGTITVAQGGDGAPDPLACCAPDGPGGPGCPEANLLWIESDDPCTTPFECPPNGWIQSACGFGDVNTLVAWRGDEVPNPAPNEWINNTTYHQLRNTGGPAVARAYVQHFVAQSTGTIVPFGGPQISFLEEVTFTVGYSGRRWHLFSARVFATAVIYDFDTVWNPAFGAWQIANIRFGNRVLNAGTLSDSDGNQFLPDGEVWFDRDFCISGSGDAVELSIDNNGLRFGDAAFSFVADGFIQEDVVSNAAPPPPIPGYEFKFTIREWECENPLP